ncbi:hypothetical protein [Neochlamydia sp. S13]|uniref:hypothetical protein n=1 Tax=Neochlamydia sp. S13 TaxID=1353976 RepID=UPI000693C603|nr:hypothetical protein [Neochlamydia sp. S13]BBI17724.1 Uncharacterized protein NCS13_1_1529 [Neochlamydia sp. S13]
MQLTNPVIRMFDPPGGDALEDLDEEQKTLWHLRISQLFDRVIQGYPNSNDGPRRQFFNPTQRDRAEDLQEATISWIGFPKAVKLELPTDQARWEEADSRRAYQDEYCEWSVSRNAEDKITKVTFTCEGPEYWRFLAQVNPDQVIRLYQEHVDPAVKEEDLFINGVYNPANKWNNSTSRGAMHLIQPNNTLSAEIELAAAATIVRRKKGKIITNQGQLIKCSQYGVPERNSDPHIGASVNTLAQKGAYLSLANPVGLYFDKFEPHGWHTPDEEPATNFWKIVRGTSNSGLRAIFEVPKEKNYVVGDITINGEKIKYGSQIADFVHIKLTAIMQEVGQVKVEPVEGCRGPISLLQGFEEPFREPIEQINEIFSTQKRVN